MEVLGVGPAELLVILVIMVIVVGPQRLPEMAAQLARFLRAFRRYSANVTREFNEALHELEQDYDEMRGEWKEIGQGLDESTHAVGDELKRADSAARQGLEEAKAPNEPSTPVSPSP